MSTHVARVVIRQLYPYAPRRCALSTTMNQYPSPPRSAQVLHTLHPKPHDHYTKQVTYDSLC